MKVRINRFEFEDYRDFLEITVEANNIKRKLSFCDGEPEDNTLGRGFMDCYSIDDVIKAAYKAGKAGEELEIEEVSEDPWGEG
jgi:hypothetical protein